MDNNTIELNIILPRMCPFDQTILLFDADGSITGLGEPCWYCPVCGYIEI